MKIHISKYPTLSLCLPPSKLTFIISPISHRIIHFKLIHYLKTAMHVFVSIIPKNFPLLNTHNLYEPSPLSLYDIHFCNPPNQSSDIFLNLKVYLVKLPSIHKF